MQTLLHDIRYGFRTMARNPGLTTMAVLALMLGIGANTAIFSVVDSVLLRPLPFPNAERLMHVWGSDPSRNIPFHFVFYSDIVDYRQQNRCFETLSAYTPAPTNLIARDEPERLFAWKVNANYFPMLGASFELGRGFLPEEDTPGGAPVAVVSHALWERKFGSDPGLIGRPINLDGTQHTVVGILPPRYQPPGSTIDVYTPFALPESREQRSNSVTCGAFGRLRAGVTKTQAQVEMNMIGKNLALQYPNRTLGENPRIWGLREFAVRDVRLSLLVLMAAVGLVLLIGCVNVASLLLARASAREREVAVRISLGARRIRIVRQMLTESSLLGLAGGLAGILLAVAGVRVLASLVPEQYPLIKEAGIDGSTLTFTLIVSLTTGVLFGLAPALVGSSAGKLTGALKEGSRSEIGGPSQSRLLSLLVVVEVALALTLLIASGLMIRSFLRLNAVDPGFVAKGVLTAGVTLPRATYGSDAGRIAFFRDLLQRLDATPGVRSSGIVSALPLLQYNTGSGFYIEGRPAPPPNEAPIVWFRTADRGYFHTMEIPLLKGRLFDDRDQGGAPPVAIINACLARRFWPGADPIGARVTPGMPRPDRPTTWITIVGVVGDLRHKGLDVDADAEIFYPYQQHGPAAMTMTVRTDSDPIRFSPLLRRSVASLDRELPVSQIRTMEQILADSIGTQRFAVLLLGIFAGTALALAAIGIYGVVSFSVTRRTREIGVRMALGAQAGTVLRMVVGKAVMLAVSGVVIGLAAAFALTRAIGSILYGVSATDPAIFAGVSFLLTGVAALAGYFPGRRAARIDPIEALRTE